MPVDDDYDDNDTLKIAGVRHQAKHHKSRPPREPRDAPPQSKGTCHSQRSELSGLSGGISVLITLHYAATEVEVEDEDEEEDVCLSRVSIN